MFESNCTIADEIRYVLDRRTRKNQMGSTLERPTMLMNQNFVQKTTTLDEQLDEGTAYKAADMSQAQQPDGIQNFVKGA